jgi:predicted unusual protein kinase regulating ubiquinone biosynthesis (AarF/ABC1/UbiB family)
VDSDLSHLKLALRASGLVNRMHKKALHHVFEELRARLHEELDYTNEAENVRRFRAFHANHEGIVVPDVVGERSAQRVLTLTYEASDPITQLDALGYTQEARDRIGVHLFRALSTQLFELQALQSDPNPANYGFRPDGTVVLYDFGCVKEVPDRVLTDYRRLIRAALEEDWPAVDVALHDIGARNPEGPPLDLGYYKQWRDIFLEPLLGEAPYDFGTSDLHGKAMKLIPGFLKVMTSFTPPPDLVFIDRAIGGNYGNLRQIRSRCALGPGLRRIVYDDDGVPDPQRSDG